MKTVHSNEFVEFATTYATVETLVIGFMVFWVANLFA